MKKFSVYGPGGIRVTFDPAEVDWNDPGNGTPENVYLFTSTSTLTCAQNEGELICGDYRRLTDAQCEWLNGPEVADAQNRFWSEQESQRRS